MFGTEVVQKNEREKRFMLDALLPVFERVEQE
jgi:hypothetical protein